MPPRQNLKSNRFDPHGSFLPGLWFHDLRDRLRGNRARANARWGWLRPPQARGKVVWVAAGRERASVRLGAGLVRAIREKRLDVRLVLTFEEEYPDLLAPLRELERTGWGYGLCDRPGAVERVLERFSPLGVVFAGAAPRPNLARACARVPHVLTLAAEAPDAPFECEKAYPATEAQAASWEERPQAPAAELLTLLLEAQVDPGFKTLVNGGLERHLWWLHGNGVGHAAGFIAAWKETFPDDVLFVSGEADAGALKISAWQRTVLPAGSVVEVDDWKWLPAIAAACTAAHFHGMEREALWQAMAGGCATSCADSAALPRNDMAQAVAVCPDAAAVMRSWKQLRTDPLLVRSRGDEARRRFWQERRLAAEVSGELLQRIFDW